MNCWFVIWIESCRRELIDRLYGLNQGQAINLFKFLAHFKGALCKFGEDIFIRREISNWPLRTTQFHTVLPRFLCGGPCHLSTFSVVRTLYFPQRTACLFNFGLHSLHQAWVGLGQLNAVKTHKLICRHWKICDGLRSASNAAKAGVSVELLLPRHGKKKRAVNSHIAWYA